MSHCFNSFTLSLVWGSVCWLQFLLRSLWLDDFWLHVGGGQWAICRLDLDGISMPPWLTALSSPAALWEATELQDLGKCCFLFLGYGYALGKPGCCCYPCSGEARQGLGWFGFRGAGVSDLCSRSCTGLLSITRSSCGQSEVQSFEDVFYQGLCCRGLFLSWCRKSVLGEKKGTSIHGCTAVLGWWCPETEMTDDGCCVILKGKELGQSCAKLGVEGSDNPSANSVWMSVLGYWREMRACLRNRVLPVHLRPSDHYELKSEGFACTVELFHSIGQCNIDQLGLKVLVQVQPADAYLAYSD